MPRPTTLPAGNTSHTNWGDLTAAWTFHATGNTGGADADDIKGSNDATLSGATLSDTLGLDSPTNSNNATITEITCADAFSIMFRCKLDAVGNDSMVFGNASGSANYLWLDSGTNRSEFKKGASVSLLGTTDSEKTTLYDYCLVVEAESGSLHQIKLYRKTTAGTTWTEISSGSTNNLDSFSLTHIAAGHSSNLGLEGEIEYFFVFDGTAFTLSNLDTNFSDPYTIVEAPDTITLTAKGIHDRVRYIKPSGTYSETVAGSYNGTPTSIEWRFGGSGSWTVGDASPSGGTFSFSAVIDGTTAGQGLEVRFSNDTDVTDSDDLFTICEVYLLEADSLANGSADNEQVHTPRTYSNLLWRSSGGWVVKGVGDGEDNHWPILANRLSDDRPVAFLQAASGGAELTGIRASTNASNISAAGCVGVNGLLIHGGANEAIAPLNATSNTPSAWSTEVQALADDYATTYPGCKTYLSISGPVGSGTLANVHSIREGVLLAEAANSNVEIGSNVWWRALGDNLHPKSDDDITAYANAWWFAIRTGATSQPKFSQATHNSGKTIVTVQYDATLRTGTTLTAALFEVTDDGTPVTISTAAVDGMNVVLTLASAASGTLTVSTGKGLNNTGTPPEGASVSLPNSGGNYFPSALPFYDESVTAADDTPPVLASAAVPTGGTVVQMTFTEAENAPVLPVGGITGFTVGTTGTALTVLSACRTASTVITLAVDRPILSTETITVSYSSGNVTDSAPTPNSLATFSAQAVTNNSTQTGSGTYADAADVRSGTDRGDGTLGTLSVPTASQVLNGVAIDATTGNVVLPAVGDVQTSVTFGASSGLTGTFAVPTEAQVQSGVGFGAAGTEFTGSLSGGGTGAVVIQHIMSQDIDSNTTERIFPVVAKASGSPITTGTVNYYLKAKSGTNVGKWWRDSDQTWQATETANAMTHEVDGSWEIDLSAAPFSHGVRFLEYVKESGDLHAPVSNHVTGKDTRNALSGAYTVTITVDDGTNPIENASVRMYRTGETETKDTNASGQAVFTVDAATWSVALQATGFDGETNSLAVSADAGQTYSMTASSGSNDVGYLG